MLGPNLFVVIEDGISNDNTELTWVQKQVRSDYHAYRVDAWDMRASVLSSSIPLL